MLFQVHEYLKPTARAGKKKRHTLVCSVKGCSWKYFKKKQLPKIAPRSEYNYEIEAIDLPEDFDISAGIPSVKTLAIYGLNYRNGGGPTYTFAMHFKEGSHATGFMLMKSKVQNKETDY